MIAQSYIEQGFPIERVLQHSELSRSSYYYRPKAGKVRGRPKIWNTYKTAGEWVHNDQVILDIKYILSGEFVDYGYHKVTYALKQEYNYLINHKKSI